MAGAAAGLREGIDQPSVKVCIIYFPSVTIFYNFSKLSELYFLKTNILDESKNTSEDTMSSCINNNLYNYAAALPESVTCCRPVRLRRSLAKRDCREQLRGRRTYNPGKLLPKLDKLFFWLHSNC